MKENEVNYFAFKFCHGVGLWFGWHEYPEHNRSDFTIYFFFMQFAWVKQMMDDEDADEFINNNQ
jgi:hypothetical protein